MRRAIIGALLVIFIMFVVPALIGGIRSWISPARAAAVLTIDGDDFILLSREELVAELRNAWNAGFQAGSKAKGEPPALRLVPKGPPT